MAKPRRNAINKTAPVDNAEPMLQAKITIRRNVLGEIGADKARVLDAYAGAGAMHSAVWAAASTYAGIDTRFFRDSRTAYVGDNRRVLRAIDLTPYNVFDLDAYGSPWEQAIIIAARRKVSTGERLGFVLTEGSGLHLKMNGISGALRSIAGIQGTPSGIGRAHGIILDAAVAGLARRLGCTVEKQWRAQGKSGAMMRYVGLVLRASKPAGVI